MKKSIGTWGETSLHRELKFSYAASGHTEAEFGGFVADGISADGEFIEVQTGSFGPLKDKARVFTEQGRLRIVHPIIIAKYIEVFDSRGKQLYRRKSPQRGSSWDLFNALVHAPELPLIRGLTIELVLVDVSEQRIRDGKGSWRRKGVSIRDRKLLALHECIRLKKPSDYLRFIPFKKNEQFTSDDLRQKTGICRTLARKTLYVLVRLGIVKIICKRRNTLVFSLNSKTIR